MILLTGFYRDADPCRSEELLECVRRNVDNAFISEIHVFLEDRVEDQQSLPASPKVRLVDHGRRVTYQDLFSYASKQMPDRRVIIANADIYFDHSLA